MGIDAETKIEKLVLRVSQEAYVGTPVPRTSRIDDFEEIM
jgi:hypothetical protein